MYTIKLFSMTVQYLTFYSLVSWLLFFFFSTFSFCLYKWIFQNLFVFRVLHIFTFFMVTLYFVFDLSNEKYFVRFTSSSC